MTTLADVFASVEVSQSDGILILSEFLQNNADRSPTLVASLQSAIADLVEPPVERSSSSSSSPSGSSTTKSSTSSTSST
jgi:hypothetical protein